MAAFGDIHSFSYTLIICTLHIKQDIYLFVFSRCQNILCVYHISMRKLGIEHSMASLSEDTINWCCAIVRWGGGTQKRGDLGEGMEGAVRIL